jgi:hypothetical protein
MCEECHICSIWGDVVEISRLSGRIDYGRCFIVAACSFKRVKV